MPPPKVALNSLDVTKKLFKNMHKASDISFIRKSLILYDRLAFNIMKENREWEGMVSDIIGTGAPSKIESHMRKSLITSDFLEMKQRTYKESMEIMLRSADRQKLDEQKLLDYLGAYFENESLYSNPPWSDPLHVPFQFPALAIASEAAVSYIPNERDYNEIGKLFEHGNTTLQQSQVLEIMFPKLNDLSIEDLFEMRQDPLIDEFRKYIHSNTFGSTSELSDRIQESTAKLLRGSRPAKDGGILVRIFNNLPFGPLPFNPVALINDFFEVQAERNRYFDFGWLFSMHEHPRSRHEDE